MSINTQQVRFAFVPSGKAVPTNATDMTKGMIYFDSNSKKIVLRHSDQKYNFGFDPSSDLVGVTITNGVLSGTKIIGSGDTPKTILHEDSDLLASKLTGKLPAGFEMSTSPATNTNSTVIATTKFVKEQGYATADSLNTELNLKANKNNAELTGNPYATGIGSGELERIATAGWVDNRIISNLQSQENNADTSTGGTMSPIDKKRLDSMFNFFGIDNDGNPIGDEGDAIDKITEVLKTFESLEEGNTIAELLAEKAPKDSPQFTGTPKMLYQGNYKPLLHEASDLLASKLTGKLPAGFEMSTSPATNTNSTVIATTKFVKEQGYATADSLNTELNLKANKNNAELTGNPYATNITTGASERIATAGWVDSRIGTEAPKSIIWTVVT